MVITSRENPTVKLCRRLQNSGKARREEGLFLAEGARLCREVLSCGLSVEAVLATRPALAANPWLTEREVVEISPDVAAAVSDTKSPQGVFCLCRIPPAAPFSIRPGGRYLLLDRLQDPGNLGTILRGAEAFGITAVILGSGCPDRFSPKVLRSTMGSVFRQPVLETDDLTGTVQRLRETGMPVWAAMPDDKARPVLKLPEKGGAAVVVGNEGSGVSPEVFRACCGAVYIPMAPGIESLNAAAAATVIMWELSGRGREGQTDGK